MMSRHQLIRITENLLCEVSTASDSTNFVPNFLNNLPKIEKVGQVHTQRGDVNRHVTCAEEIS
jgi:hypothetical protein